MTRIKLQKPENPDLVYWTIIIAIIAGMILTAWLGLHS